MMPRVLKALPALAIAVLLSGCASSGPPLPPSLELPAAVSDLRAVRKGDRVFLTWSVPNQTTDHENVRHYGATRVCRSTDAAMSGCGNPVATLPPPAPAVRASAGKKAAEQKVSAAYVDHLPTHLPLTPGVHPEGEATYAVEVFNTDNRSAGLSNRVRVSLFPAIPPPEGFQAKITAEGVNFGWKCPAGLPQVANVQYRLRINRALNGSASWSAVAEANLATCPAEPVFDLTFEWEKTYEYRANAVTIVSTPGKPRIEIEGDDTASVTVFAHDIFPPAEPSGLQAVFSGAGQLPFIDLVWSPDTDADLAGYYVYRHEDGGAAVKLNAELIKASAYRDSAIQTGKRYFYSVSAVDVRGNESARSSEADERVP